MHEDAQRASLPLTLDGGPLHALEVRLLSPLDRAVSKIGRLSSQDRDDIAALARRGLIGAAPLRERAEEAATGYAGDLARIRRSIELACRRVRDSETRRETCNS